MALSIGFEPTTYRLTAGSSAVELAERNHLIQAENIIVGRKAECNTFSPWLNINNIYDEI